MPESLCRELEALSCVCVWFESVGCRAMMTQRLNCTELLHDPDQARSLQGQPSLAPE